MPALSLRLGDTIGIISPCCVATAEGCARCITVIKSLGFRVKEGANLYKSTFGYSASEQERADDFNNMVLDNDVRMILFGGGWVGNEILPYIDYSTIKQHPKIFCSYSDGTTILNAIYTRTGQITYYGQAPVIFSDLRHYDYTQFQSHFISGGVDQFTSNSKWEVANGGSCAGILVGGYTRNLALLVDGEYSPFDKDHSYILFLEDHEKFSQPAEVSSYLSHIEQSAFISNISGLLFGHYSATVCPELMQRLERFGRKHGVPVVYCDDFGHGANHAILPIGCTAELNAETKTMRFCHPD